MSPLTLAAVVKSWDDARKAVGDAEDALEVLMSETPFVRDARDRLRAAKEKMDLLERAANTFPARNAEDIKARLVFCKMRFSPHDANAECAYELFDLLTRDALSLAGKGGAA